MEVSKNKASVILNKSTEFMLKYIVENDIQCHDLHIDNIVIL